MWGGSSINDDIEFPASLNGLRTLVLVGRIGNGKSATGNSIIGTKKFLSRPCFFGARVTTASEPNTIVRKDGQMLNVIDTPGLFNSSVDAKIIEKEIVKCIKMARDGIHAVISFGSSVSEQQEVVISSLRSLLGNKINDYMILVLTGGEQLEENEQTFEDFLEECPSLKRGTIKLHEDPEQDQALKRYIKQEISDQIEDQLKRFTEMEESWLKETESRLKETTSRIVKQWTEGWIAELKATEAEICKLREKIERIKAHI